MNITFKRVNLDDWKSVFSLEKKAENPFYFAYTTEKEIKEHIKKSTSYLICKNEKKPIGFISYEKEKNGDIYFNGLVIDPNYRKQGVAKQAIEFIMKEVSKEKRIYLHTHPKNTPAIKTYFNFGFVITSWVDNPFGDGEPRLILEKQ